MDPARIRRRLRAARRLRDDDGQALVEFAVVAPLLVLLLFAVLQFGVLFNNYLVLTDAVRVGGRTAAVSRRAEDPSAAAAAAVRASAANLELADLAVAVNAPGGWRRGADVVVAATYPYDIDLLGFVVKSGRLTSQTTERIE